MSTTTRAKTETRRLRPGIGTPLWPIAAAAVGVALIIAVGLVIDGSSADRLVLMNRYLARFSFLVFVPIYLASPLVRWVPGAATRGLRRIRRSLGLAYALIMAAHLCAIFAYQRSVGAEPLDLFTAVFGGLGFVLIGAMAATSTDRAVQRMGQKNWRRLHLGTLHWLWVIYVFTYLGRIEAGLYEYLPGLVVILLLPLFRLSARFRPTRERR